MKNNGFMFLLFGKVTYLNHNKETQTKELNALHYLDHEVVWPEDLEGMYKAVALNFTKLESEAEITGVVLGSISMLGCCSREQWQEHSNKNK